MGVVRLLPPLMPVLRPVIGAQEKPGTGHTLAEGVKEALRLAINPVQVFKDQHQRLVQTLPQEQLLQRLEGSFPPDLRVHLL